MTMSRLTTGQMPYTPAQTEQGQWSAPAPPASTGGWTRLEIGALVVVGLGLLGWYVLGPDLRRYMKIRSM